MRCAAPRGMLLTRQLQETEVEKFTVWLSPDHADKVRDINDEERRKSISNTLQALVGEALDAREEREAKGNRKSA